jgi:hypothetical protein
MKRTNLVLDEHLLAQATQVLAAKTYSAAVNTALEEVIRLRKRSKAFRTSLDPGFGKETSPKCEKTGRIAPPRPRAAANDLSRYIHMD